MSETMRAVTLKNGEIALREIPRPAPGPGQILVRTLACAICASDHHYMDHPEVARVDRSGMRVHAPEQDVTMGHEFCAELVEYGPDTRKQWPRGTRVTSVPALFVDGGMRIIGMAPDAPGGFGEYFLLSEGLARPVPDGLPPQRLALTDAMAVGWYYTGLGHTGNTVPLVIGLGAIGQSIIAALEHRGAAPIVAADYNPARRELATTLGADVIIDPARHQTFAEWRRTAWGAPDEVHDRIALTGLPSCTVYECTGAEGVLADIVDNCPIGTRVLSAGGADRDTIASATAHLKGLNIQFGGGPMIEHWYETLDLVIAGALDPTPLIGETVGLDDLPAAFERARTTDAPVRIVYTAD
ncbi:alcohol dehydrogenase catalytic domain-containing protein [Nocardia testacea]|uniref:alcohol dehydrogenase catalytic domain-containing protein n=1 Tax=Nocardia testacea TaxID=248551 RepID=UPI0033C2CB0C